MKIEILRLEHAGGDWWRLHMSDGQALSILASTLATLKVAVGQRLSPDQVLSVQRQSEIDAAYVAALSLLSYRQRSVAELRRQLTARGHAEFAVNEVIRLLCERGMLDDDAFAGAWVRDVLARRPAGRERLWHELRQKGVAPDVATRAIDAAFERVTADAPEGDPEAALACQALRARLAKTGLRKIDPEDAKQRRRLIAFLRRRGFQWRAISAAFQACELEWFR